jgi:hypothetical protein
MREIRLSGSEGGVADNGHLYPYRRGWTVEWTVGHRPYRREWG